MVDFGEAETQRLSCRRPGAGSLTEYRQLFGDETVNRWLRPPPLKSFTAVEIDRLLRHDRNHWRRHGFGPWLLSEREGGRFVGRGGLAWTRVEGRAVVELPWALLREFQGVGLATEQAKAAICTARSFGIDRLVSLTLPRNLASRRVMEKSGFQLVGEVEHAGLDHVLYELPLADGADRPAGPDQPTGAGP